MAQVLRSPECKPMGYLNPIPALSHGLMVAVSLGLSFTNPAPTNARDKTSQLCACKVQVSSYQLELQDLLLLSSNKYMKFTLVQIIQAWQL